MSARCARSRTTTWTGKPARGRSMRWRKRWHHERRTMWDRRSFSVVCQPALCRLEEKRHNGFDYSRLILSGLDVYMLRFILLLASGASAVAQQYTIATVAGGAPPATPVAGASISIGQPRRVTLDTAGNVYFSSSNSVFKLSVSGVVTLVAGNSRAGFSGDNGSAVNAQLNTPQGLALDSAGNLYIADSANNRIRIVSPARIISAF